MQEKSICFLWIWKFKCCNKLRVFSSLLMMDRLNTSNIIRRKKTQAGRQQLQLCPMQYECWRNGLSPLLHLFFQPALLAVPWHLVESYVRFLPNDNTSQTSFSISFLHGSLHGKSGCSIITSFLTEDLHPSLPGEGLSKMKLDYKRIGFLKTSNLFFSPGLIPMYSVS